MLDNILKFNNIVYKDIKYKVCQIQRYNTRYAKYKDIITGIIQGMPNTKI